MTFTFTSTFKEQFLASLAIQSRSLSSIIIGVGFAGASVFLLSLHLFGLHRFPQLDVLILIIVGFTMIPLLTAFNVWTFRRQNKMAVGEQTYTFDETGLSISGDHFEAEVKWSGIRQIVETNRFFLFYISSQMAYFLPKWIIGDLASVEALRSILRKHKSDSVRLKAQQ